MGTTIPTPGEIAAGRIISNQSALESARKRIADAMRGNARPITIATRLIDADVIGDVLAEVRAKGWRAEVIFDQRDGDYIEIKEPIR